MVTPALTHDTSRSGWIVVAGVVGGVAVARVTAVPASVDPLANATSATAATTLQGPAFHIGGTYQRVTPRVLAPQLCACHTIAAPKRWGDACGQAAWATAGAS